MAIIANDLRRSCTFCRQRKMKCTGENPWCKTCKERCQPCVYEISAPKGRPRRREHGATLCGEALGLYGGSVNVSLDRPGTSARHAYFRDTLEEIYHELWQPGSFLSNAAEAIRTSIRASSSTNGAGHGRDPMLVFPPLTYNTALMVVTYEMTEAICTQLSSLDDENSDEHRPKNRFEELIAHDRSVSLFESISFGNKTGDPLDRLDQLRALQLIEYAFANHPFLCIIVSRTLFVKDHAGGTHDRLLLSVIIGEAIMMQESDMESPQLFHDMTQMIPRSQEFFSHAFDMLRARRGGTMEFSEHLSTLQAVVLLAWNKLCRGQIRRSLVFFAFALQFLVSIFDEKGGQNLPSARINGIATDEIEDEMLNCIFWIVHTVSLWANIQAGSALPGLDCPHLSVYYPPYIIQDSKVWCLEAVSGYTSATMRHKESLGQCKILSHIMGLLMHVDGFLGPNASKGQQTNSICLPAGASQRLRSSLVQIFQEARNAFPLSPRYFEPFGMIRVAHEFVALHICLATLEPEPISCVLADPQGQTRHVVIDLQCASDIMRAAKSLAEQANVMAAYSDRRITRSDGKLAGAPDMSDQVRKSHWCKTLLVRAIDSALRACEIVLVSCEVTNRGEVPKDILACFHASSDTIEWVRQQANSIAGIIHVLHESLGTEAFACPRRRHCERHSRQLLHNLSLAGIQAHPETLGLISLEELERNEQLEMHHLTRHDNQMGSTAADSPQVNQSMLHEQALAAFGGHRERPTTRSSTSAFSFSHDLDLRPSTGGLTRPCTPMIAPPPPYRREYAPEPDSMGSLNERNIQEAGQLMAGGALYDRRPLSGGALHPVPLRSYEASEWPKFYAEEFVAAAAVSGAAAVASTSSFAASTTHGAIPLPRRYTDSDLSMLGGTEGSGGWGGSRASMMPLSRRGATRSEWPGHGQVVKLQTNDGGGGFVGVVHGDLGSFGGSSALGSGQGGEMMGGEDWLPSHGSGHGEVKPKVEPESDELGTSSFGGYRDENGTKTWAPTSLNGTGILESTLPTTSSYYHTTIMVQPYSEAQDSRGQSGEGTGAQHWPVSHGHFGEQQQQQQQYGHNHQSAQYTQQQEAANGEGRHYQLYHHHQGGYEQAGGTGGHGHGHGHVANGGWTGMDVDERLRGEKGGAGVQEAAGRGREACEAAEGFE